MADGMNPEARARLLIEKQLEQAGWVVQNRSEIDLVNHTGVAVRETIMDKGPGRADYLLYLDKRIVGVIEAKPSGTTLTEVEWQSRRYAQGLTKEQKLGAVLTRDELPFIFEASGTETHYTNLFDPDPRSRHIFNFPKPETLARVLRESETHPASPTWRERIAAIPNIDGYDLRPVSRRAVEAVEKSLQNNQHSLISLMVGN